MIDNRRPPCDVLDATMFWSPQSGGVGRYLRAKHEWLSAQPGWAHTIATPLADAYSTLRIPSLPLPFSGGYRVPVARAAAAQCLAGAEPDLIEAGDPYRLAWAALDAAERRGVPAVAFCHSNLELLARSLAGEQAAIWARRYTNRLYRRFALALAPSRVLAARLAQVFSAQNAWRRAVSIGWNRLLASAQARHPLVRLELHPADVQHAAVRRTWVAILRQAAGRRRALTLAAQIAEWRSTTRSVGGRRRAKPPDAVAWRHRPFAARRLLFEGRHVCRGVPMDAVLLNAAMRVIDWHRDHDLLPSSEVESPPVSERPSTHVPADATSGRDAARPAWPPADSA